jgi:signal transduction histidine kinase
MLESEKLTDLGKIAHSLGHDIKTEMGIILSYINKLLSGCDKESQPDLFDTYTEIRDAALYSTERLQNMLLASTPTPPKKKLACLENIFRGIKERMERQASSKRITFSIAYPEADYDIYVDVEQIKQVLWNLYNNSLFSVVQRKRTDMNFGGGRIEVSAHVDGNHLILFWRDDGTGIPDDIIPNIFNAFFTRKASGSGLGLYISKSIIDAHGGQISVESNHGVGTCFRITLPILKDAYEVE